MEGFDLFLTELGQYGFKAIVLSLTIVAAIFAGIGIRKIVNKKKAEKEASVQQ